MPRYKSRRRNTYLYNNNNNNSSISDLFIEKSFGAEFKKYKKKSSEYDPNYNIYYDDPRFIHLIKINPSIYFLNVVFLKIHKKSLIKELLKTENEPFYIMLSNYFDLAIHKKEFDNYPILKMLFKHKFNTIYDIILENPESFYLIAFLGHMNDVGLFAETDIESSNDAYSKILNSNLHKLLRQKEIYFEMVPKKMYTRIKSYNTNRYKRKLKS